MKIEKYRNFSGGQLKAMYCGNQKICSVYCKNLLRVLQKNLWFDDHPWSQFSIKIFEADDLDENIVKCSYAPIRGIIYYLQGT